MDRRNTRQKRIVLDAVRGRCDHPTAEQIAEDVQKLDSKISVGTVYRNLGILAEEGKILGVRLPSADRFDLRMDKHNHFLCEKCGRLFDIDIAYDESLDEKRVGGFSIKNHQTIFSGLCPECSINQEV